MVPLEKTVVLQVMKASRISRISRINHFFPTTLCGVLVFDSVSRVPPPASSLSHITASSQLEYSKKIRMQLEYSKMQNSSS